MTIRPYPKAFAWQKAHTDMRSGAPAASLGLAWPHRKPRCSCCQLQQCCGPPHGLRHTNRTPRLSSCAHAGDLIQEDKCNSTASMACSRAHLMSGTASMPRAICSPSFDGCLPFSCMRGWLGAGIPANHPAHLTVIRPWEPPDVKHSLPFLRHRPSKDCQSQGAPVGRQSCSWVSHDAHLALGPCRAAAS